MPLSGMGDLEDLFEPGPEPENESTPWRLRSRVCVVADMIGARGGNQSLCCRGD